VRVLQVNAGRREAQRVGQWLQAASARPAASAVLRDSAAVALSAWIGAGQRRSASAVSPARRAQREALHAARGQAAGPTRARVAGGSR